MTPAILALDLGDTTGWAARFVDGATASGVLDLGLRDHEHPGARWPRVRRSLEDLVRRVGARWIVWERIVAYSGGLASKQGLYGLEVQLVEVVALLGLETKTVNAMTLKKWATGTGKATKADMRSAAAARWPGLSFATHDEVDARWILEWAMHELQATEEAARGGS